ncbi:transposase [Gordonia hongkongensis]|uniref:transposase n=1 Tax=Gordonia hongkongensis TaxID=1701090 RepID=UPI003D13EBB4
MLKNPDNLTENQERLQSIVVNDVNSVLARAYQMKEEIRHILSGAYPSCWAPLRRWLKKAETCDIPEIRTMASSIRKREVQIHNAVACEMSKARVEATNCHLRSLTKRSYGFHTPEALIAMANLTRGGACPDASPSGLTETRPLLRQEIHMAFDCEGIPQAENREFINCAAYFVD